MRCLRLKFRKARKNGVEDGGKVHFRTFTSGKTRLERVIKLDIWMCI